MARVATRSAYERGKGVEVKIVTLRIDDVSEALQNLSERSF